MKNILIISTLLLSACSFQSIFKREAEFFRAHVANNPIIKANRFDNEQVSLFYSYTDNALDSQALIVFVHGTPGSWSIFGRYLINQELLAKAQMVAIDRPGWGLSSYKDTALPLGIEPSIANQVDYLVAFIDHINPTQRPLILVGFSYGVPVAISTALDYPNRVNGLMLLAGMLDPTVEAPRWYNNFTATALGQWIVPMDLKRSNIEMMAKQQYISESAKKYANLTIPLTVIQGENDELVYPSNLDYAKQNFNPQNSRVISIPNQGHIVVIEQHPLVFDELESLLERLSK